MSLSFEERNPDLSVLVGKTFDEVRYIQAVEEVRFCNKDECEYKLYHSQDCCESVVLQEIIGDLKDLEGTPILVAEEVFSAGDPPPNNGYPPDSYTWTFYKFSTIKGSVTLRWYGESNGYYSEGVDFERTA